MAQEQVSDGDLVARCRIGDETAWAELVERYSRYVYGIALQGFRLPDPEAEDVFQDVFMRAYEHLDSLRDDEALRPWLAQLTRRLIDYRTFGILLLNEDSGELEIKTAVRFGDAALLLSRIGRGDT